eukprot:1140631-Pelagomonas_calceolata.AAC.2
MPPHALPLQVVFDGKMASLRRIKDDVEEVSEGVECGLGAENFTEWKEGDKIECYTGACSLHRGYLEPPGSLSLALPQAATHARIQNTCMHERH